jgi:electron transfer flavoprotein alpha/beta subunit
VVETELPAVVLIPSGAHKPRYPDGPRLINVYREAGEMKDILERWNVDEHLSAAQASPLIESVGRDFPPERERGELVEGTVGDVARTVAEALSDRLRV